MRRALITYPGFTTTVMVSYHKSNKNRLKPWLARVWIHGRSMPPAYGYYRSRVEAEAAEQRLRQMKAESNENTLGSNQDPEGDSE